MKRFWKKLGLMSMICGCDFERRNMIGQITLEEYLQSRRKMFPTCGDCVCYSCLYWWSERCPYGECWDDYRAEADPYDAAHPDQPPRKWWLNWNKPGEQEHWCRGGNLYPVSYCPHFVKYQGQIVKHCLFANVSVFQDGYIGCSIVNSIGCQEYYRRFEKRTEREWEI